jgi:hypothetical protein
LSAGLTVRIRAGSAGLSVGIRARTRLSVRVLRAGLLSGLTVSMARLTVSGLSAVSRLSAVLTETLSAGLSVARLSASRLSEARLSGLTISRLSALRLSVARLSASRLSVTTLLTAEALLAWWLKALLLRWLEATTGLCGRTGLRAR